MTRANLLATVSAVAAGKRKATRPFAKIVLMIWVVSGFLLFGIMALSRGIGIWRSKIARANDPILFGGLIGHLVFGDKEAGGSAARCVGALYGLLGIAGISLAIMFGALLFADWTKRAKTTLVANRAVAAIERSTSDSRPSEQNPLQSLSNPTSRPATGSSQENSSDVPTDGLPKGMSHR